MYWVRLITAFGIVWAIIYMPLMKMEYDRVEIAILKSRLRQDDEENHKVERDLILLKSFLWSVLATWVLSGIQI